MFKALLTTGMFVLMSASAAASGVDPCEQLVFPGMGQEHFWTPSAPAKMDLYPAVVRGKKLAKLGDRALLTQLNSSLPGGFMVTGASTATLQNATVSGQFTGSALTASQLDRAAGLTPPIDRQRFLESKFVHGVTSEDLAESAAELIMAARDAARAEATGHYVLSALAMDADHFAPLVPIFSRIVEKDGGFSSLRYAAVSAPARRDRALQTLIGEAERLHGEPAKQIYRWASYRRGFLLVFRDSAYLNRLRVRHPTDDGSLVALAKGRGLTEAELYAVIPLAGADQGDLKDILTKTSSTSLGATTGDRR